MDVKVDEGRHAHVGAALHGRSADLGPNGGTVLRSPSGPPGGQHDAEAGLLQRGRLLRQELVRLLRAELCAGRFALIQAVGDGLAHRAGLGQGGQQELGWVEVRRLSLLGVVHRQQETVVVVGLEQVAEIPVLLTGGGRWYVLVGFGWFFQPQAEAVGRVCCHGDGPVPFRHLPAQLRAGAGQQGCGRRRPLT